MQDENGLRRRMHGSVTEVHKPLGAGSEMANNLDAYIWDTGGVLLPRGGKVAQGLQKEFNRLVSMHGSYGEIKLHREGNLYNYYVKKVSKTELAPVSTANHEGGWKPCEKTSANMTVGERTAAAIGARSRWADLEEEDDEAASRDPSSSSGFTRPAMP